MDTLRAISVALAVGLVLPIPVHAFDVTGSWVGKASCKGFADGRKFTQKIEIAAVASQSGRDVAIQFAGLEFIAQSRGVAIADATKPDKGELGIVACENKLDPVFAMTGRAKVTTVPSKGKGALRIVVLVAGKDIGDLGITDGAFTCAATLKRISTAHPGPIGCALM